MPLKPLFLMSPELQLALFVCLLLVLAMLLPQQQQRIGAYTALLGIGFAAASLGVTAYSCWHVLPQNAFGYRIDSFGILFKAIALACSGLSIIASIKYLEAKSKQHCDYYALILLAVIGMMLASSARDLIVLYLSLELSAVSTYLLVWYPGRLRSAEGALTYYLLAMTSTGILLYGMSVVYATTGETSFDAIVKAGQSDSLFSIGITLMSLGILFKVAAIPLHAWLPDTCEAAPTPVIPLLLMTNSTGYIVAITLVKLFPQNLAAGLQLIMTVTATVSMMVGNLAAATQTNLKRMLGYAGIAHSSNVMLAVALTDNKATFFYIASYCLTSAGICIVLSALSTSADDEETGEYIDDLNGLFKTNSRLGIAATILLLSFAGIPPTCGFIAKYLVLSSVVKADLQWQLLLIAINVPLAFYISWRCIRAIFEDKKQQLASIDKTLLTTALLLAGLIAGTGIYPQPLIRICDAATAVRSQYQK